MGLDHYFLSKCVSLTLFGIHQRTKTEYYNQIIYTKRAPDEFIYNSRNITARKMRTILKNSINKLTIVNCSLISLIISCFYGRERCVSKSNLARSKTLIPKHLIPFTTIHILQFCLKYNLGRENVKENDDLFELNVWKRKAVSVPDHSSGVLCLRMSGPENRACISVSMYFK